MIVSVLEAVASGGGLVVLRSGTSSDRGLFGCDPRRVTDGCLGWSDCSAGAEWPRRTAAAATRWA